jgi:hypothetical protein
LQMHKLFLAALLSLGFLPTGAASGEEPFSASAHSEALYLVLTSQREELKAIDQDPETQEMKARTWSVFRPVGAGVLDMANTFTVTLSIDGKPVASWYVNTGEGTVERNAEAIVPALRNEELVEIAAELAAMRSDLAAHRATASSVRAP